MQRFMMNQYTQTPGFNFKVKQAQEGSPSVKKNLSATARASAPNRSEKT